eukprot:SAG31_NODE_8067_length_1529_cov_1.584615_1_plen_53_part_10
MLNEKIADNEPVTLPPPGKENVASTEAVDILKNMLSKDPSLRTTVPAAYAHPF